MIDVGQASDATLVVAIGRWNEEALAEAYRRHGGAVHGLARRLLGTDGRADDLTQEVFVGLWTRPERFDPPRGSLRAFLLTVTHGRAVDLIRSDTARTAREQHSAADIVGRGYDLESEVGDALMAERVREAVGELPEGERRAIELAYFRAHAYRDVAKLLEEPEGTVTSWIRRGLRRLHGALADEIGSSWIQS